MTSLSPLCITRRMKSVLENPADVRERANPRGLHGRPWQGLRFLLETLCTWCACKEFPCCCSCRVSTGAPLGRPRRGGGHCPCPWGPQVGWERPTLCHLSMAAAGPEGCGWKGAVGSREGELRWASPHPLQAARRGGTGLGWTLGVRGHLASPSFGRTASLAS